VLASALGTDATGTGRGVRRRAIAVSIIVGAALPLPLSLASAQSNGLTTFYPNLNPSLAAIKRETVGARKVLTDDSVLRYHLYSQLEPDDIVDPFFIEYEGVQGIDGYRRSIADRYWDAIVLDGGVGPLGERLRRELGSFIPRYYRLVYSHTSATGVRVEIYRPREEDVEAEAEADAAAGGTVYAFSAGLQGWGAHPPDGEQRPGLRVAIAEHPTFRGDPSLRFASAEDISLVSVRVGGTVRRVSAGLFVADEGQGPGAVRIGMVGFDAAWRWRDDGFQQVVPTGRWVTVRWDVANPGIFEEIGLKFPDGERHTVYVGRVHLVP